MKFWKVVSRDDNRLSSAIRGGLQLEYVVGESRIHCTREQHAASSFSYYFPKYVPGLFVFTNLEKAKQFKKQWGDTRELWECEADLVEKRSDGVAIARNVVLKRKVEVK